MSSSACKPSGGSGTAGHTVPSANAEQTSKEFLQKCGQLRPGMTLKEVKSTLRVGPFSAGGPWENYHFSFSSSRSLSASGINVTCFFDFSERTFYEGGDGKLISWKIFDPKSSSGSDQH